MNRRVKTGLLGAGALGALGVIYSGAGPAAAQGPATPAGPLIPGGGTMQLQMAPRLQVAMAPELRNFLVQTKIKVAPQVLDSQFVARKGTTFLKLNDGTERALLPLSFMEEADSTATEALPSDVTRFLPLIRRAKVTGDLQSAPEAEPLAGAGEMAGGSDSLPGQVDHRFQMTPVKDQGARGTCVAFASNAALEPFPRIPDDLSEQYTNHLFMIKENRPKCEDGIATYKAASYLKSGTVSEPRWTYTSTPPACNVVAPATAIIAPKYGISSSFHLSGGGVFSIKNLALMKVFLRQGHNIVLGTHVAWDSSKAGGILDVVINSATNQPAASRGGHAMLIVGYNTPQRYFIVKNSWGTGFGHGGYLYLSEDYLRTYAKYGYIILKPFPA